MSRPEQPASPAVVARDRIQHLIVAAIAARQRRRPRLVFKGGTLLRSCWREDYRYSEDLDFDWVGPAGETSAAQGLAPAASQDFAAIFEGVETQLAAALTGYCSQPGLRIDTGEFR